MLCVLRGSARDQEKPTIRTSTQRHFSEASASVIGTVWRWRSRKKLISV
jgi:hypothetical protein